MIYPNSLHTILTRLNTQNIQTIIVGGFVRDFFLGTASKDIDVELYGVTSLSKVEVLLKEFGSVNIVGSSFGVCKLKLNDLEIDFSLPRTEKKLSAGHKGFSVITHSDIPFKTAALRRDFTINAIGYNTITKEFLDPYNGIRDIQNSLLRFVNENTFIEDPLRILRAVQFSARFHLTLHTKLFVVCKKMIEQGALYELSQERIFEELLKLLFKAPKPSLGFKLLKQLNAQKYFSEFQSLSYKEFYRSLRAVDRLKNDQTKNKKRDTIIMLTALCYYLPEQKTVSFLSKITKQKEILRDVIELKKHTIHGSVNNYQLYRLALHVKLDELLRLQSALFPKQKNLYLQIREQAKKLGVLEKSLKPIIQGRDLIAQGLQPSLQFRDILEMAYEKQMREVFTTHKEAILWLQELLS